MTKNGYEIARSGAPLDKARGAVILLHGRGGMAEDMLALSEAFAQRDISYVALQAPSRTWYPHSFLAPISQNEPHLTHSLAAVGEAVRSLKSAGLSSERIALIGFSQGACLALEFAARNAERFGGVAALSGGLIGQDGTPRDYRGSLAGTPVFIGCSDVDSHIPLERVNESAAVVQRLGANVTKRIYPGMGHTVVDDEIRAIRAMLAAIAGGEKERHHAV
ncbi:alpha/beta hydrolase [Hyphomicrobium sp.]|uniref:alpha/beta hydrolase n=1 Tax=Hyphomicrobium sp. TaxID=82 RepID=UPI002E364814|nr:dienelactone hydrolase family protein [Hyphomicrobium sp.]HEX2840467.1 dienelactone hydrolase family protein [Hyphomicrobium sp.]